ncbi:N-acetylmuramoyl-L-alanine amidase [Sulfurimonas sp. CVO]|jgi:N-acetylmuramoyl-L-alanine amidase|uniref:N-acetylmuramoyl-L-alanine amidase n=1 Tax=Sulfurimonas xiamenensis TaxID=2590021 RepID=A0AAJ4DME9_9BACT|nr:MULTISPECIES: N-acetylmuramoyl-L-alanine amidase [Sulfurimonas]QFR42981.1 N-acetylmuramoyl-L-alanine amidase [Sulfurimonas xiamenensis]QHG91475.1 N-acetylmuramoyl-L-alanine amidase [Sulfurimonas sp. CVO]
MIKYLFLFLFLFISLEASKNSEILNRAHKYMQSNTQSDTFRAYNDYKNLYLQSAVANNLDLKIKSLEGIVQSGNRLHIDVSKYSNELKTLQLKNSYNKPKPKAMKKTKHIEDVHIEPLHKLKSIDWKEDILLLTFNKPLSNKQIKDFTLHDKSKNKYRYVFDIKTSMLTSSQSITKNGIDRIRLAQFDPKTLRLVIENSSKLDIKQSIDAKTLQISFILKTAPIKIDRDKVIVIDAGHGGKDPGAVGYKKYREKIVVFKIAKELQKILKSRGYKVHMTRDSDKFVKLSRRTKFANEKNADIFISIHANAVDGKNAKDVHGIECYFLSPTRSERAKKVAAKENSADMSDMNMYGKNSYLNLLNHHNIVASNKLAIDLQRGMLGALNKKYKNVKDGGVREGPFWVLVGAQMPSVLVEVGFISHPMEAKRLVNDNYRKTMARGLADGVERYFANN